MRNTSNYKYILCIVIASGLCLAGMAQENANTEITVENDNSGLLWGMVTLFLFIFFGLVYLIIKMRSLGKAEKQGSSFRAWWSAMDARLFTKAIPLEKEADHLLDHDYDGIKELDNSLPPWWKYGFYITVVIAVIYLLRFHVWKTGPTPEQEYNREMAIAEKQIEEYRKKAGDMVDEKTVSMADATGIAEGQKIYQTACMACHGGKGEGGVGPNLTDDYWLHGGRINDVFKTIKQGVPEKGMQAWEKTYSPSQIKNIASYIKTLAGSNPPNAKAPQGEIYKKDGPEKKSPAGDSTSIVKR